MGAALGECSLALRSISIRACLPGSSPTPSTPADNKGMLKAVIRCDDPVVYMEHKALWATEGEVPEGDEVVPLGEARIAREGRDLTIVSWSAQVLACLGAADALAAKGIEAEVIDLRTLWPWDKRRVLAS